MEQRMLSRGTMSSGEIRTKPKSLDSPSTCTVIQLVATTSEALFLSLWWTAKPM